MHAKNTDHHDGVCCVRRTFHCTCIATRNAQICLRLSERTRCPAYSLQVHLQGSIGALDIQRSAQPDGPDEEGLDGLLQDKHYSYINVFLYACKGVKVF
jgi:hypothetical protein